MVPKKKKRKWAAHGIKVEDCCYLVLAITTYILIVLIVSILVNMKAIFQFGKCMLQKIIWYSRKKKEKEKDSFLNFAIKNTLMGRDLL